MSESLNLAQPRFILRDFADTSPGKQCHVWGSTAWESSTAQKGLFDLGKGIAVERSSQESIDCSCLPCCRLPSAKECWSRSRHGLHRGPLVLFETTESCVGKVRASPLRRQRMKRRYFHRGPPPHWGVGPLLSHGMDFPTDALSLLLLHDCDVKCCTRMLSKYGSVWPL